MTLDLFMHALGVASQAVFAGGGAVAVATIVTHVGGQWHRITVALRGEARLAPACRPAARPARPFILESTKMRDAA